MFLWNQNINLPDSNVNTTHKSFYEAHRMMIPGNIWGAKMFLMKCMWCRYPWQTSIRYANAIRSQTLVLIYVTVIVRRRRENFELFDPLKRRFVRGKRDFRGHFRALWGLRESVPDRHVTSIIQNHQLDPPPLLSEPNRSGGVKLVELHWCNPTKYFLRLFVKKDKLAVSTCITLQLEFDHASLF